MNNNSPPQTKVKVLVCKAYKMSNRQFKFFLEVPAAMEVEELEDGEGIVWSFSTLEAMAENFRKIFEEKKDMFGVESFLVVTPDCPPSDNKESSDEDEAPVIAPRNSPSLVEAKVERLENLYGEMEQIKQTMAELVTIIKSNTNSTPQSSKPKSSKSTPKLGDFLSKEKKRSAEDAGLGDRPWKLKDEDDDDYDTEIQVLPSKNSKKDMPPPPPRPSNKNGSKTPVKKDVKQESPKKESPKTHHMKLRVSPATSKVKPTAFSKAKPKDDGKKNDTPAKRSLFEKEVEKPSPAGTNKPSPRGTEKPSPLPRELNSSQSRTPATSGVGSRGRETPELDKKKDSLRFTLEQKKIGTSISGYPIFEPIFIPFRDPRPYNLKPSRVTKSKPGRWVGVIWGNFIGPFSSWPLAETLNEGAPFKGRTFDDKAALKAYLLTHDCPIVGYHEKSDICPGSKKELGFEGYFYSTKGESTLDVEIDLSDVDLSKNV